MASVLQNIYLFKDLSPAELQKIEKVAKEKQYSAGQDVFMKDDKASALYVIQMGGVKITNQNKKGDDVRVAQIGSGAHFGEIAFLDGEKRSASAQVAEPSTILELSYESLKAVLDSDPILASKVYRSIALYLAGRLRVTTEDLNKAKDQNIRSF
ncbi:MAG: Crp/Fnr family transcriptional regulator [Pseudobdellovibrionaceae bacterium]